jgi:hypothetical protein
MTASNTPAREDPKQDPTKLPSWFNAVLGAWLFASAFLWHHDPAQFHNTWVVGIVVVVLSCLATFAPWTWYLNAFSAVWLFVSTLVLPRVHAGTTWHNCLLAIAIFGNVLGSPRTGRPARPVRRR